MAKSSVMDKILEFAIGPLLGGLGAGLGQPSSQQYQSFTGSRTDPRDMMSQGRDLISRLADMGFANANRPVNLPSSYAQPLPSFSGGGLPMTIGASGRDPALNNPSLLHLGNNGPGADVMSAFELLGFKPNKGKSLLG